MTNIEETFLELLRAGLWGRKPEITTLNSDEWCNVQKLANEQTVTGLIADAIEMLSKEQWPDLITLLKFIGIRSKIEAKNLALNQAVAEISKRFAENDIPTVLLKGQIIAQEYRKPLRRNSGDIDFYIDEDYIDRACSLVKTWDVTDVHDWHRDFGFKMGCADVELHWSPVNPREGGLERKLHEWCRKELKRSTMTMFMTAPESTEGECFSSTNQNQSEPISGVIAASAYKPTTLFNLVYIFYHFFHHFVLEGVGLRHICDWVMLLHNSSPKPHKGECDELRNTLERFKLMEGWMVFEQFAIIYLGLPEKDAIFSKKSDKTDIKCENILRNILHTGNFGHNVKTSAKREGVFWERVEIVKNELRHGSVIIGIFPGYLYRFFPNIFSGIWRQIIKKDK